MSFFNVFNLPTKIKYLPPTCQILRNFNEGNAGISTVSFGKLTFGVLSFKDNTWARVEYIFGCFTWYLTNERSEQVRLRAIIGETGSCVYNCDNQSCLHIYPQNENM